MRGICTDYNYRPNDWRYSRTRSDDLPLEQIRGMKKSWLEIGLYGIIALLLLTLMAIAAFV